LLLVQRDPDEQTGGESSRWSEPLPTRAPQETCAAGLPGKNCRNGRVALAGGSHLMRGFLLSQDSRCIRGLQWNCVRRFQVGDNRLAVGAADDVLLPGIHFLRKQGTLVIGREGFRTGTFSGGSKTARRRICRVLQRTLGTQMAHERFVKTPIAF